MVSKHPQGTYLPFTGVSRVLMNTKDQIWIADKYRSIFEASSSINLNDLFSGSPGKVVRIEDEKRIYYFSIGQSNSKLCFYLKQEKPKLITHLKHILKNRKFYYFRTRHELELLRMYKAQGVPVVEPVAWGEQSIFGIPIRGFLVQLEVQGKEFTDLVKKATTYERTKLIRAYGKFVADLHSKGLISSVARVTDLICTSPLDGPQQSVTLVVIDRESGLLQVEPYTIETVSAALASTLIRFFIYIGPPSNRDVKLFLSAYLRNLSVIDRPSFRSIYLATSAMFEKMSAKYRARMNTDHYNASEAE